MAATRRSTLDGYRVALSQGDRNAQVWALAEGRSSYAAIGKRFGFSRARAQAVHKRAVDALIRWPEPNPWQRSLPLRLRELCAWSRIEGPAQLLEVLAKGRIPRQWTAADLDAARRALELDGGGRADDVLVALRFVLAALAPLEQPLQLLTANGVVGAAPLQRAVESLRRHGEAVHRAFALDAAAIAAANATAGGQAP